MRAPGRKRGRQALVPDDAVEQSSLAQRCTRQLVGMLKLEAAHQRTLVDQRGVALPPAQEHAARPAPTLADVNTAMGFAKLRMGDSDGPGVLLVELSALLPPQASAKTDEARRLCNAWRAEFGTTDAKARLRAGSGAVRCMCLPGVDAGAMLAGCSCVADVLDRIATLLGARAPPHRGAGAAAAEAPPPPDAASISAGSCAAAEELECVRRVAIETVQRLESGKALPPDALKLAWSACDNLTRAVAVARQPALQAAERPARKASRARLRQHIPAGADRDDDGGDAIESAQQVEGPSVERACEGGRKQPVRSRRHR